MTKGDKPSVAGPIEDQHKAALERVHRTSERAAQQFTKLLGTVHGGLGVACATWLQRIFEQSAYGPLSPLAWYLAIALGCVALGLVALALTTIIDQRSAFHAGQSVMFNVERVFVAKRAGQIDRLLAADKSVDALFCLERDKELVRMIANADASATWINGISERLGIGSWACVIAAFATLAVGIIKAINHLGG
jgi:hypothetical protein